MLIRGPDVFMSDKDKKDETWHVRTANGSLVKVRCPVCGDDRFGSARPPLKLGSGFVHVTVGQELEKGAKGRLLAMPTKSKSCLNCGFILKFAFFENEEEPDGGR